ncbi:MAG: hypothetical protein EBS38_03900 [Actinobacteria bacterium]|nr:hypothetical protein [Actinomycetota bacterium]
MKQYTAEEIQELLTVTGGDAEEQAAALAVVEAAILESRRLGRIALRPPKTTWHRSEQQLRGELRGGWGSWLGK